MWGSSSIQNGWAEIRLRCRLNRSFLPLLGNGQEPTGYVLNLNRYRRHLTSSQLAIVAARLMDYEQERAKERMAASGKKGKRGPANNGEKEVAHLKDDRVPASREIAGARVGMSGPSDPAAGRKRINSPRFASLLPVRAR